TNSITGTGARRSPGCSSHMQRELAQHCGHADILREQILAGKTTD
ncbi:MAG: DUF664 domain-containing protein, partial [Pseudarthrobacter sp.]|nr:DUF664 domain-containing protein [Pseudarthrobacter sp.]